MNVYISHPFIKEGTVEQRKYQDALVRSCLKDSTLVVIPTGMGKTIIALRVIAEVLRTGAEKALMLAPTRPLVEQHRDVIQELMPKIPTASMTGETEPEKRAEIWKMNRVIVSTPQVLANDIEKGRYTLQGVGLIVYDEAHRAVGNYSYVKVAKYYAAYKGLSMGITASPGSNSKRIIEVCENLRLSRIEVRTEDDPDVMPYIHNIQMEIITLELPDDIKEIIDVMRKMLDHAVSELVELKFIDDPRTATAKRLLDLGRALQARVAHGERVNTLYRGLTLQAIAMKLHHAIGLAETQGITALSRFLDRLEEERSQKWCSRATRELLAYPDYEELKNMVSATKAEHPKVSRVMTLVSQQLTDAPGSRILVFTHYRDTCEMIAERLGRIDGAKVGRLIGQSGEDGLKQRGQAEILRRFREGDINVLVATSVGEEGLDVANTDMVIFYEPVPSEIRSIQRRGRTGRFRDGRVYILVANGTRDKAFLESSELKEKRMKKRLQELDRELTRRKAEAAGTQTQLSNFQLTL